MKRTKEIANKKKKTNQGKKEVGNKTISRVTTVIVSYVKAKIRESWWVIQGKIIN